MEESITKNEELLRQGLAAYSDWVRDTLHLPKKNAKQMAPLALAYLGDAVYELFIRTMVVSTMDVSANRLNGMGVSYANAKTQARFIETCWDSLSEEERTFVQKGKNAKVGSIPKSCTPHEYHLATGFECMFGYLFMSEAFERLTELFALIKSMKEVEK